MTQVIVLKAFSGKAGDFQPSPKPVHVEDDYAKGLIKNGLVKLFAPEPSRRQAMPGAPQEKKPGESSRPLGDGPDLVPSSSRAARARAKKTPNKSGSGVTPRRADEP